MDVLRIKLFGRFEVVTEVGPVVGLEARKVQELVSYLLIFHTRPVLRELLADRLWPNVDGRQAKKYLRQALWQLRKALQQFESDRQAPVFLIGQEWIEKNPSIDTFVDAHAFVEAHERAAALPGVELTSAVRSAVVDAVGTYRGRLMEGCYEDWCLQQQDLYRSMYLRLLDRLMLDAETMGDLAGALAYGRRALAEDRVNEQVHTRMMRLYAMMGNRTEALRQYQLCLTALREELDVEPEPDTIKLCDVIRDRGQVDLPGSRALVSAGRSPYNGRSVVSTNGDHPTLGYLREFHSHLQQLQHQVTDLIRELDHSLP